MPIQAAGFFLCAVFFCANALSQPLQNESGAYRITLEDISKTISRGEQPGLKVDIYEAEKKKVESKWSKAIRKETKSKVANVNNEISIHGTLLKQISLKPLNVYSIINQYDDHIELNAFFESENSFLTKEKHETEYLAARKFLRDFAVEAYREVVQMQIKTEEKKLSSLERELDDLVKENDKLHKKINEEKRSIDNAKEKIVTSELDQERVKKQVQEQKMQVSQIISNHSSKEVVKEAEKKLKNWEAEVAKLEKQEDSLHRDINKSEAAIREAERGISANGQAMQLKQNEITRQKQVVYNYQKKWESIK
ncbi:MAG TPA: hypothetical protein VNJ07_06090 [Chitinophagales bacterium]|nr:hypothetical protein [Chitinophagales bacterium]